jgi:hypothetical protein
MDKIKKLESAQHAVLSQEDVQQTLGAPVRDSSLQQGNANRAILYSGSEEGKMIINPRVRSSAALRLAALLSA